MMPVANSAAVKVAAATLAVGVGCVTMFTSVRLPSPNWYPPAPFGIAMICFLKKD
jgi:hypothetical protein